MNDWNTERPPGLDALLDYVAENLQQYGVTHNPMLVRWANRHTLPAEVCDTCSDVERRNWVPVTFCNEANAKLQADPDCAYTYGVLQPEDG